MTLIIRCIKLIDTIKKIIRLGRVTSSGADDESLPKQQYGYHGKLGNAIPIYPYGFHAIADGESYALIMILNGNNNERVSIPTSMLKRPKGNPGEVFLYHPNSGTEIKLDNDGNVIVNSTGNVQVNSPDLVRITSPVVEIVGDLDVSGNVGIGGDTLVEGSVDVNTDLTVVGATTLSTNVTSNSKDISESHQHNTVSGAGDGKTSVVL